jgi:hypothetical protein
MNKAQAAVSGATLQGIAASPFLGHGLPGFAAFGTVWPVRAFPH